MRETGQVMQETERSVPFERLAGSMPLPELTQAPGFAGGLAFSVFRRSASQRAALRARPFLPSASTYARV